MKVEDLTLGDEIQIHDSPLDDRTWEVEDVGVIDALLATFPYAVIVDDGFIWVLVGGTSDPDGRTVEVRDFDDSKESSQSDSQEESHEPDTESTDHRVRPDDIELVS